MNRDELADWLAMEDHPDGLSRLFEGDYRAQADALVPLFGRERRIAQAEVLRQQANDLIGLAPSSVRLHLLNQAREIESGDA